MSFYIQSCYTPKGTDVLIFHIGVKKGDVWMYEYCRYYSFDDHIRFDELERFKENREFVQNYIIKNKNKIVKDAKNLLNDENWYKSEEVR